MTDYQYPPGGGSLDSRQHTSLRHTSLCGREDRSCGLAHCVAPMTLDFHLCKMGYKQHLQWACIAHLWGHFLKAVMVFITASFFHGTLHTGFYAYPTISGYFICSWDRISPCSLGCPTRGCNHPNAGMINMHGWANIWPSCFITHWRIWNSPVSTSALDVSTWKTLNPPCIYYFTWLDSSSWWTENPAGRKCAFLSVEDTEG